MPVRAEVLHMRLYPEPLAKEVRSRSPLSGMSDKVRLDLDRYYQLLQRVRIDLPFTPEEATFIVNRLREQEDLSVRDARLLRYDLEYAVEQMQPPGIQRDAFVAKLEHLTLTDWVCIVDAVERYLVAASREVEIPAKLVRLVGLTRD